MRIVTTACKLAPSVTSHFILLLAQGALCGLLVWYLAPVVQYFDNLPGPEPETLAAQTRSDRQMPGLTDGQPAPDHPDRSAAQTQETASGAGSSGQLQSRSQSRSQPRFQPPARTDAGDEGRAVPQGECPEARAALSAGSAGPAGAPLTGRTLPAHLPAQAAAFARLQGSALPATPSAWPVGNLPGLPALPAGSWAAAAQGVPMASPLPWFLFAGPAAWPSVWSSVWPSALGTVPMTQPAPGLPSPGLPAADFSAAGFPGPAGLPRLPGLPGLPGLAGPVRQALPPAVSPGMNAGPLPVPDTLLRQPSLPKTAEQAKAAGQASAGRRTNAEKGIPALAAHPASADRRLAHPSLQAGKAGDTRSTGSSAHVSASSKVLPDGPAMTQSPGALPAPGLVQTQAQPSPALVSTAVTGPEHGTVSEGGPSSATASGTEPVTGQAWPALQSEGSDPSPADNPSGPQAAQTADNRQMSAQPSVEAGVPDMVSELLGRYPIEHQAGQEIVPAPVRFLPRTRYAHIPGLQLTLPADPATASADAGASGGSAASAHAAGTGAAPAAAGQAAAQTAAQAAVQASPLERISRPVLERVLKKLSSAPQVDRQSVDDLLSRVPGVGLKPYAHHEDRTLLLVLTQPDCRHCRSMQAFLSRLREDLSFPVLFLPIGGQPSSLACYTREGATLAPEHREEVRGWLATATTWLQTASRSQAPYVPTFVWITDGEAHRSTLTRTELAVLASYLNARVHALAAQTAQDTPALEGSASAALQESAS